MARLQLHQTHIMTKAVGCIGLVCRVLLVG